MTVEGYDYFLLYKSFRFHQIALGEFMTPELVYREISFS